MRFHYVITGEVGEHRATGRGVVAAEPFQNRVDLFNQAHQRLADRAFGGTHPTVLFWSLEPVDLPVFEAAGMRPL